MCCLSIHEINSETEQCSTDGREKVVYEKVELNLMLCEKCNVFLSNSRRIGQCFEILVLIKFTQ